MTEQYALLRAAARSLGLALAVTLASGGAAAAAKHDFYAKFGSTTIIPNLGSGELTLHGLDETGKLAFGDVQSVTLAGTGVQDTGAETIPGLILGYKLPWFGGRFAVETIIAPPISFTFEANDKLANEPVAEHAVGGIPTGIKPLGRTMGETDMLPPVVTLVYRPLDGWIQPYVGAGATYLYSYNSRITNSVLTTDYSPTLEIDNKFSYVLQAGLDLMVKERFFVNADFKYIGKTEMTARISDMAIRSDVELWDPIEIEQATVPLTLEPYVIAVTIGWRFSL